jgi:hypothetical protein
MNLDWGGRPLFTDLDDARAATRVAGIAGFVAAAITTLVFVLTVAKGAGSLAGVLYAFALINAATLAGLAWGTYKGSRFAAIGLLVLYALEQVFLRVNTGSTTEHLVYLGLCGLFYLGIRGAFALHRMRHDRALTDQVDALDRPPSETA